MKSEVLKGIIWAICTIIALRSKRVLASIHKTSKLICLEHSTMKCIVSIKSTNISQKTYTQTVTYASLSLVATMKQNWWTNKVALDFLLFRALQLLVNRWRHIWGAVNLWHLLTVTMIPKVLENAWEDSVWSPVRVESDNKQGQHNWNLKKRSMNFRIKSKPGKTNWRVILLKISSKQMKFAIYQSRVRIQILACQEGYVNIVTNTPILCNILSWDNLILDIKVILASIEVGAIVLDYQVLEEVIKK